VWCSKIADLEQQLQQLKEENKRLTKIFDKYNSKIREFDELNNLAQENKQMRELIKENATWCDACQNSEQSVDNCCECWDKLIENNKQALKPQESQQKTFTVEEIKKIIGKHRKNYSSVYNDFLHNELDSLLEEFEKAVSR